jgi:hypothetical protein
MESLEQLLPPIQNIRIPANNQTPYVTDILEGKKDSIEGAKVSAETLMKDSKTKELLGRFFGGILGVMVLFGSITNVIQDFKTKKRSPWVYCRIILDFVASGALIGYALEQTLIGLSIGLIIGIITMLFELKLK